MTNKFFDLSEITLKSNGSVSLNSQEIIELDETHLSDISGGYEGDLDPSEWTNYTSCTNTAFACETNSKTCVNVFSCGDTTNNSCTNRVTC